MDKLSSTANGAAVAAAADTTDGDSGEETDDEDDAGDSNNNASRCSWNELLHFVVVVVLVWIFVDVGKDTTGFELDLKPPFAPLPPLPVAAVTPPAPPAPPQRDKLKVPAVTTVW